MWQTYFQCSGSYWRQSWTGIGQQLFWSLEVLLFQNLAGIGPSAPEDTLWDFFTIILKLYYSVCLDIVRLHEKTHVVSWECHLDCTVSSEQDLHLLAGWSGPAPQIQGKCFLLPGWQLLDLFQLHRSSPLARATISLTPRGPGEPWQSLGTSSLLSRQGVQGAKGESKEPNDRGAPWGERWLGKCGASQKLPKKIERHLSVKKNCVNKKTTMVPGPILGLLSSPGLPLLNHFWVGSWRRELPCRAFAQGDGAEKPGRDDES